MFSHVVDRFTSTEKEGEFVGQFILGLYQSVSQLMMSRDPGEREEGGREGGWRGGRMMTVTVVGIYYCAFF